MLIREETLIRATPERAWELISDPSLHDLWNPRIVETEISSSGPPTLGFRYRVTYELKGRRNQLDAEITEFSPPLRFKARLEQRFKGDGRNCQSFVEESYLLSPRGGRTRVRHDIRVHGSGANVFLRILVWLIMRFGRPTGQPFMERFRELVESEEPRVAVRGG